MTLNQLTPRVTTVRHFQSRVSGLLASAVIVVVLCGLALTTGCDSNAAQSSKPVSAETTATYDQHLARANALFKEDKLEAALAETKSATTLDQSRYEAYATAALILHASGKPTDAAAAVNEAAKRVPPDKQGKVEAVAKVIGVSITQTAAPKTQKDESMSGTTRRQLSALMLIIEEAQQATEDASRAKLLQEFLDKSAELIKENPALLKVWSLRAAAALELNQPKVAWEAGQQLIRLGADDSQDAATQAVMAKLERKGWLGKTPPASPNSVSGELLLPQTKAAEPSQSRAQIKAAEASQIKSQINTLESQLMSLAEARLRGENEHPMKMEEADAIRAEINREDPSRRTSEGWARYKENLADAEKYSRIDNDVREYRRLVAAAERRLDAEQKGWKERYREAYRQVEELKKSRFTPTAQEQALTIKINELASRLAAIDSVEPSVQSRREPPVDGNRRTTDFPLTDLKGSTQIAVLGGGSFYCVEAIYQMLPGVKKVVSGYAGGNVPNPTYKMVCSGETGHSEVIEITFNSDEISYGQILDTFWEAHDPTTLNRQGEDVGNQYRSIILYSSEAQKAAAEMSKAATQKNFSSVIVTEIMPLERFYSGEGYHQNYYRSNPDSSYSRLYIQPKVEKFEKFEKKLKAREKK